jgi:hypothetical protein
MKQIVLRYGLLSGALTSVLMISTSYYYTQVKMDFENGQYVGYAGILLSMLFIFFGVRTYREQTSGPLSFGKAFQIGLLIALVSCLCYVLAWMVVYETMMPDFMDKYIAHALEKLRQSGAAESEIQAQAAEMAQFKEMYKNPLTRAGLTFLEPFPVGFLVALVSAIALRRR